MSNRDAGRRPPGRAARRGRWAAFLVLGLIPLMSAAMTEITLLHTNDAHGRYLPFAVAPGDATAQTGDPGREPASFGRTGAVGGIAHLATAINAIRAEHGRDAVLLLAGGDSFADDLLGNLTEGEAMIRLMNAVGYQFMALGNHDFDYGVARTRALQQIADFPLRAANVLEDERPFLGEPSKIFTLRGVKIAVLALGYHNTDETGSKKNFKGLRFVSGLDAAREQVPKLRREADAVVVLSHQGSKVDRELARRVPGIDVIVGAHSHDVISPPERIGDTWIAQALSDGAALGELKLRFDAQRRITDVSGRLHMLWSDRYPPAPDIQALVQTLRAPQREKLEQVIATADERIGRQYRSESPFDVMVGDILRAHTGAEVALLPGVGYGVSLSPGPVTREMLYTLLPHPSKVVTMELDGERLLTTLEQSATNQRPADPLDRVGGLIQTAGIAWTVDLTQAEGRRVRDVTVNGKPLEPGRYYRVVTHDGMRGGLHRYVSLQQGRNARTHDERVTEVVEAAWRKTGQLRAPRIGAVTLIKPPDNG